MSVRLKLTPMERIELKAAYMRLWHEYGETQNKASMGPETCDLWVWAVSDFLAAKKTLKDSDDSTKDGKD